MLVIFWPLYQSKNPRLPAHGAAATIPSDGHHAGFAKWVLPGAVNTGIANDREARTSTTHNVLLTL